MQSPPRLTADDQRSIRDWSFAMALLYGLFIAGFLALAMLASALTPAEENAGQDANQPNAPHFDALRASD